MTHSLVRRVILRLACTALAVALAASMPVACAGRQVAAATAPAATGATAPAITLEDLRTRLFIYADDSMLGRRAGTPGSLRASNYLAAEARRIGLEPAGDSGTYFQDINAPGTARFNPNVPPGTARNVVAILRGSDPVLRHQYVALGAHSDHIGIRTAVNHDSLKLVNAELAKRGIFPYARVLPETRAAALDSILRELRPRLASLPVRLDSIANGADDDGSGSVALLEIAEALASAAAKPKRSILFVWHNAEEAGLIGSRWYADNPTVPRDSIVVHINMDMIGRGGENDRPEGGPAYLELIGSRRISTELGDLIELANSRQAVPFRFNYTYDAAGHPERLYCRSDHANYARYGIPVAFFSTGLHGDYHQVTDEPQYINYPQLTRITAFLHDVTLRLANMDRRLRIDKPVTDPLAACVQ